MEDYCSRTPSPKGVHLKPLTFVNLISLLKSSFTGDLERGDLGEMENKIRKETGHLIPCRHQKVKISFEKDHSFIGPDHEHE